MDENGLRKLLFNSRKEERIIFAVTLDRKVALSAFANERRTTVFALLTSLAMNVVSDSDSKPIGELAKSLSCE